jgi:predicted membrane channel-forming protein YqfA (hemolysin III family)
MKINIKYLIAFIILFLIEVGIALFINDRIIRPYIGDILIIILMYTFIKSFTKKDIRLLSIYLFIFAVFVEVIQLFNIIELVGLHNNIILSIILGSTFDLKDILCYLIGSIVLLIWDNDVISYIF